MLLVEYLEMKTVEGLEGKRKFLLKKDYTNNVKCEEFFFFGVYLICHRYIDLTDLAVVSTRPSC